MNISNQQKLSVQARNAVGKLKVVEINNKIAQHANRKELAESVRAFQESVENGWANSYTYAAILNAYVRCGDMEGAKTIFQDLKTSSKIPLDVISCTTMMKGFCQAGDIASALNVFTAMDTAKPPVVPNIRTMNTFFRGCLLSGTLNKGDEMFTRMQKIYHLSPDISTWEYIVAMLCQGCALFIAFEVHR